MLACRSNLPVLAAPAHLNLKLPPQALSRALTQLRVSLLAPAFPLLLRCSYATPGGVPLVGADSDGRAVPQRHEPCPAA